MNKNTVHDSENLRPVEDVVVKVSDVPTIVSVDIAVGGNGMWKGMRVTRETAAKLRDAIDAHLKATEDHPDVKG